MFEVVMMFMLARSPAAPTPEASSGPLAVIVRSASTNTPGVKITVSRGGDAAVISGEQTRTVALQPALAAQLYADLERTAELDRLPVEPCMKSASFGTTTFITFIGKTSPDLQCASDAAGRALYADADAIARVALAALPQRRRTQPVFRKTPPSSEM